MLNKILFFILTAALAFNLYAKLSSYTSNGTIMAVNIQARTIQVNELQYGLSDKIIILSTNSTLLSQADLKAGQKIEFMTTNQQEGLGMSNPELPPSIITKIHVLSGWDARKALKQ